MWQKHDITITNGIVTSWCRLAKWRYIHDQAQINKNQKKIGEKYVEKNFNDFSGADEFIESSLQSWFTNS